MLKMSGSAPFYYDWPVELRLLDPVSHEVKWKQVFNTVDIHDWMPGEEWNVNTREYDVPAPVIKNTAAFTIDHSLPRGKYILALAILDPAGMVPSVKFATSQYFNGGMHPIGFIGIDTVAACKPRLIRLFSIILQMTILYAMKLSADINLLLGGQTGQSPASSKLNITMMGERALHITTMDSKRGDPDLRAEDNVDIVAQSRSKQWISREFYPEEAEWLEYTSGNPPQNPCITWTWKE